MDVVDLDKFKEIRRALQGSSADAIVLIQVITAIDYMADMLLDHKKELDSLRNQLRTLEKSMEEHDGN